MGDVTRRPAWPWFLLAVFNAVLFALWAWQFWWFAIPAAACVGWTAVVGPVSSWKGHPHGCECLDCYPDPGVGGA